MRPQELEAKRAQIGDLGNGTFTQEGRMNLQFDTVTTRFLLPVAAYEFRTAAAPEPDLPLASTIQLSPTLAEGAVLKDKVPPYAALVSKVERNFDKRQLVVATHCQNSLDLFRRNAGPIVSCDGEPPRLQPTRYWFVLQYDLCVSADTAKHAYSGVCRNFALTAHHMVS